MLTFQVDDIHCGHCVRAIKDALRELDASASIDVDVGRRLVKVRSDRLDATSVRTALLQAGYSPDSPAILEQATTDSSHCCGCTRSHCGCAG